MLRFAALPILAVVATAVGARLFDAPPPLQAPRFVQIPLAADLPAPEPPPPIEPEAELPAPTTPAPLPAVQDRLTADELRKLSEARFSDETIIAYARVSGRAFRPTPEELIALKDAGMTDALLGRLMGAPVPASAPSTGSGQAPTLPVAAQEPRIDAPAAPIVVTPPPVYVYPTTTVYAPVDVTVVTGPPAPAPEIVEVPVVQTLIVCAAHRRPGCCVHPVPAWEHPPRQESSFFRTREWMPTKRLPTAEEAARRQRR